MEIIILDTIRDSLLLQLNVMHEINARQCRFIGENSYENLERYSNGNIVMISLFISWCNHIALGNLMT